MSKESASKTHPASDPAPVKAPEVPSEAIEQAVKSIKYGVVQLIIQDGRVIQIDKTEKIRLV
ncbi:MAG: YezD family protein [Armatimonadetes bacterium]|nr:YezD family protein [Armatimonadota bacterium]